MKTLLAFSLAGLLLFFISAYRNIEKTVHTVDIGINVSDTVRSLAFYTKVLGMRRISTWRATKEMSVAAGVNSGRAFNVIDLNLVCDGYILKYKLNHTEGNIHATASNTAQFYSFENIGERYLTINVENVDPFIERIKENGHSFKLVTLPDGYKVLLLKDPDGALLEISGS